MEDPTIKWASSQNDPKNAADLSTYRGDFVLRSDLRGASAQNVGCFVLRSAFWRGVRTKRGYFVLRRVFRGSAQHILGNFCAEGGVLRDAQNKRWGVLC